ncbi:MAG: FAD-dependent oxidoreductase [Planctomycetota bacterium]|nr:FAD-dependent oxidoreductase [Planctomycetota bacterium]
MVDELLIDDCGLRIADCHGGAIACRIYGERLQQLRDGVAPDKLTSPPPPEGSLRVAGIRCSSGLVYTACAVILTTGTFLRGLIHQGQNLSRGGRAGEVAAMNLSASLEALGFELRRLKTGTPPRVNGRTINVARYCPSVEDKVVRFPEKECHQIFLEPEGVDTEEFYVNGLSTSLPPEVQIEMVRSLPGCQDAGILRFGYAIEYDMAPPHQIRETLAARRVSGLYLAGQINGTSGYEEAAGQGILAGINAALEVKTAGRETLVLGRDEAYIGIMVDDLVTKDITEPYRLFTSRGEYRLLLRQDNADRRLAAHARRLGLLDGLALAAVEQKRADVAAAVEYLRSHRQQGSPKTYWDALRQPEVTLQTLGFRVQGSGFTATEGGAAELSAQVAEAVHVEAKYEGYLQRQREQVDRLKELETRTIPESVDYRQVSGLGREAVEKLGKHRPRTFGQALRIDGVTPADMSLLAIYLTQHGYTLA